MKRIAITVMLLAVLMLAGCSTIGKVDSQKIAEAEGNNRMFMTVSREWAGIVLVDKTTMVMYWASHDSHNCGILTLLVNPDGTPRIWEG